MPQLGTTNGRSPRTRPPRPSFEPGGTRASALSDVVRPVDLSQPLVDADHVAAVLCVKRKRVYELARRHHDPLPSVRIGGAVRFVVAQVEEWVAAQAPT